MILGNTKFNRGGVFKQILMVIIIFFNLFSTKAIDKNSLYEEISAEKLPNNTKSGFKGSKKICKGDNVVLTFDALNSSFTKPYKIIYKVQGGAVEWEQEIDNAGKVSFIVPVKPKETTIYEIVSISNATHTRTVDFGKATVKVIVIQPTNAGKNGTLAICKGTTPTNEQLFNALGGTPDKKGEWTSNGNVYTYTVTGKSPCKADVTATVTVTEVEKANAGTDTVLTICEGETPTEQEFFKALGNPTVGGIWTHNGNKHTYMVKGTVPCDNVTATVTVKVNKLPNNTKTGGFKGKTICQGDDAVLTFDAIDGSFTTPYTIKYKVKGITTEWTQEIANKGKVSITVPVKPTETTVYELVSISNATCTKTSDFGMSEATVTVTVPANAGTNGTLSICKGTTPTDKELFNALGGTPDKKGAWTHNGNVHTYTVTGKSACKATATATVIVTEVTQANAGTDGVLTICEGETLNDEKLFKALKGNPTAGGKWTHNGNKHTYTVKGTTPCSNATATVTVKVNDLPNNYKKTGFKGGEICQGDNAKLTFKALSGSFTTSYKITYRVKGSTTEWEQVIDKAGGFEFTVPEKPTTTTTYEIISISNGSCPRTTDFGTVEATVTVTAPANAGTNGTLSICKGTTPTDEELFKALGGTPNTGGDWTHNGNVHTYTVTGKSVCKATATATVIVTEVTQANAGTDAVLTICEGETLNDEKLFKALKGNPTAGGTWTHNGNKHTYTVKGTTPCGDATATVTVKVNKLPNNTKTGGFKGGKICQGDDAVLTFDAIDGSFTTPYIIRYKIQGSTTEWTKEITEKGKVSFTVPKKLTKTTVYELVSISNATCTRTADFGTTEATVEVITPANAGTNRTLTICKGTTPTNKQLFNALGGTPDKNGTWTNQGNVYTYTVTAKSPCTADATATVMVTEVEKANAGTDAVLPICESETPTEEELLKALGNPTVGGTWTHNGNKHTYTVKGTVTCGDATATVTVKENKLPNNGKTAGFKGGEICQGEEATLTFDALNKSFTTPYQIVYKAKGSTTEWTQEITKKGKVSFTVPDKPTTTTIYELVSISNTTCTRTADFGTTEATIEVIAPANAGTNGMLTIDEGITPTHEQLFNALGGTPDKNGIWTNEKNTYTYTVKSKSPCMADATAKVIVKVKEIQVSEPILNIYQQTICSNDKAHFTITNYDKNLTYMITSSKGVVMNGNKIEASEGTYTIISKKGKKESSKVAFKVIVDATLPNCDADNDGLTNAEEISVGTNPNDKDTDGDGINDLEEIGTIDNPMDTDDDGKIDALESNTKDDDGDGVVAQLDKYDDDPCYPKVSAKCNLNGFEYPEGFSPNNDGINDKLVFSFLKKYTRNKVRIYNRYGNLVFETSKYGLYDNYFEGFSTEAHLGKEKLPVGTYFYVIEFYVNEETLVKKEGYIYLNY